MNRLAEAWDDWHEVFPAGAGMNRYRSFSCRRTPVFPAGAGMNRPSMSSECPRYAVFPAGAGMNRARAAHAGSALRGVPRRRGDEPALRHVQLSPSQVVFPAGAGMNRRCERRSKREPQVFPAGAGMNRVTNVMLRHRRARVPRRRGDEPPFSHAAILPCRLCSPQARG